MTKSRLIVFGDVHGYTKTLGALLDQIQPTGTDRIISVGDLIHKGPDSSGTVRLCREAGVELVLGNHEDMQNKYRKQIRKNGKSNSPNADYFESIEATFSEADIEYMNSAANYLVDLNYARPVLVIHGGILPEWKSKADFVADKLCRVRFLDSEGKYVRHMAEDRDSVFWAEVYDGRFGFVLFGHEARKMAKSPKHFAHAVNLDTGCGYGGVLSALVLHQDEPMALYTQKTKD